MINQALLAPVDTWREEQLNCQLVSSKAVKTDLGFLDLGNRSLSDPEKAPKQNTNSMGK